MDARAVEQQQALEVELVGVDRPSGAPRPLSSAVVVDELDAVRLAGLDRVERQRSGRRGR